MRPIQKHLLVLAAIMSLFMLNANAQFKNPLDTVTAEKRILLQKLELHTSQILLADIYLKVFALDLQETDDNSIDKLFYHSKGEDVNVIVDHLHQILSAEELSAKISAALAEKLSLEELTEVNRLYATSEGQYQTAVMYNFMQTGAFSPDLKKLEAFDLLTHKNTAFNKWNKVYEAMAEQLPFITHTYVKEKTQWVMQSE